MSTDNIVKRALVMACLTNIPEDKGIDPELISKEMDIPLEEVIAILDQLTEEGIIG